MNLTVQIIKAPQLTSFDGERVINDIGSFDNEFEALKFAAINKPSIILLDYELEKENTEIFIKSLLSESPGSKVILFGKNLEDEIEDNITGVFLYYSHDNEFSRNEFDDNTDDWVIIE